MSLFSSIAGNIAGGIFGYSKAKKQDKILKGGLAESGRVYERAKDITSPYRGAGENAIQTLINLLTNPEADYSMLETMPGYKYGNEIGLESLKNKQAALGITGGRAAKELARFGQDYAGTRFQDYLNNLLRVTGVGQTGVGQELNAGANYASDVMNTARARAGVKGQMYDTLSSNFAKGMQNYLLDKYTSGSGYGGVSGGRL